MKRKRATVVKTDTSSNERKITTMFKSQPKTPLAKLDGPVVVDLVENNMSKTLRNVKFILNYQI